MVAQCVRVRLAGRLSRWTDKQTNPNANPPKTGRLQCRISPVCRIDQAPVGPALIPSRPTESSRFNAPATTTNVFGRSNQIDASRRPPK